MPGLAVLQDSAQSDNQRVTALPQFVEPLVNHSFQRSLAPRQQNHTQLAVIANAGLSADKTSCRKTIDQSHGTVMPQKQAFREAPYARFVRVGEPADGQQHLILLRLKTGGFGRVIGAAQELADPASQFG
jgi:hypothetical protein